MGGWLSSLILYAISDILKYVFIHWLSFLKMYLDKWLLEIHTNSQKDVCFTAS